MSAARRPPEPPEDPPDEMGNEAKAEALVGLLRANEMVRVFVLVSCEGVVLPPGVVKNAKVNGGGIAALDIGILTAQTVLDLMIDESGIRGTFSFNATPFYVCLPWPSIGGAKIMEGPNAEPKKKERHLVSVAKDLKFDARYQDFSLVPDTSWRIPPRLRIVRPTDEAA